MNKTELKENKNIIRQFENGTFNLENRRYIGNKYKISEWIKKIIIQNTSGDTFFDVFAGTGVISKEILSEFNHIIINDFLYSNNIIYDAF